MLSPKPCIVLIGMNARRKDARRAEEEMANMGANDNQVPTFEEVAIGEQVTIFPPPMTN